MKQMMQYKNYLGSIYYSEEDSIFYGKVEYIRSLISFEGEDIAHLKANFEAAIDDYLALCQETKIDPEQPAKESANLQIS